MKAAMKRVQVYMELEMFEEAAREADNIYKKDKSQSKSAVYVTSLTPCVRRRTHAARRREARVEEVEAEGLLQDPRSLEACDGG